MRAQADNGLDRMTALSIRDEYVAETAAELATHSSCAGWFKVRRVCG